MLGWTAVGRDEFENVLRLLEPGSVEGEVEKPSSASSSSVRLRFAADRGVQ